MGRYRAQQVFSNGSWWDFEVDDEGRYRRVYVEEAEYMREFETGATRDVDTGKHDYEGFLSPLVIARFGAYMHKHRRQADGALRDSDNWQRGMPLSAYMKSAWRHFFDWWREHRRGTVVGCDVTEEALCALLFNVQGYLHEILKTRAATAAVTPTLPVFVTANDGCACDACETYRVAVARAAIERRQ